LPEKLISPVTVVPEEIKVVLPLAALGICDCLFLIL
jgi:hypothetical protein